MFIYFYLFLLAVLGLCCCTQAFSSCGEQAAHCSAFSCCGARALGTRASVVVRCGLSCFIACETFLGQGSKLRPLHWQVVLDRLCLCDDPQWKPWMLSLQGAPLVDSLPHVSSQLALVVVGRGVGGSTSWVTPLTEDPWNLSPGFPWSPLCSPFSLADFAFNYVLSPSIFLANH